MVKKVENADPNTIFFMLGKNSTTSIFYALTQKDFHPSRIEQKKINFLVLLTDGPQCPTKIAGKWSNWPKNVNSQVSWEED